MDELQQIKVKTLMEILEDMEVDCTNEDDLKIELDLIDELCEYLDNQDVLFLVVEELLMSGLTFGKFYDKIIPYFKSAKVLSSFIEYHARVEDDTFKSELLPLLYAIDTIDSNGLLIKDGVLKKVFKDTYQISVPDGVHTIASEAFFDGYPSITREIVIPKSVKWIEYAFSRSFDEFDILYEGNQIEWDNIKIGEKRQGSYDWFKQLNVICLDKE